jgi:hypothetical protein
VREFYVGKVDSSSIEVVALSVDFCFTVVLLLAYSLSSFCFRLS